MGSMPESPLITARALATRDDAPAVVDCRFSLPEPDRGEAEYLGGHVPGAVYAHLDRDLSGPVTGTNGRHPLPTVERMVERFSTWGIDDSTPVVVYDTAGGQIAARLWWMLRFLGHDAVAVLDGGLAAWQDEGGALQTGLETRERRVFAARHRPEMAADVDSLAPYRLLDARAPERYRGEAEPLDPVAGHIPGALNHPTSRNLGEDGRFLSPEVLRKRYEEVLGSVEADTVVSYCGSGVTACHNLLAMEVAGLPQARLYPGSWSEWCSDPGRNVATGHP